MPSRRRGQDGLVVRHEALPDDEITTVDGVRVTTPLRTAYDLARRLPTVEAVVAVDALTHVWAFPPADILSFAHRYVGAHGRPRLPGIVALAEPRAGSPMETRVRLAIGAGGLMLPQPQYPVGPYLLDVAYPGIRLGIEHNGRDHLTPQRALRDLAREAYLARLGWHVLRFGAWDVLRRPWWVAAKVREQLVLAARARGVALHELNPL